LLPTAVTGQRQTLRGHHPADDPQQREQLLRRRFRELGPAAERFLDGLLAKHAYGKMQARQLLALAAHYRRDDVSRALEHAARFGAFSLPAMRRILAARAKPQPLHERIDPEALDPRLRDDAVEPRPSGAYQSLLEPETSHDSQPSRLERQQERPEEGPPGADQSA
jgi:hypothetical protein